jgi:hypothetical protein
MTMVEVRTQVSLYDLLSGVAQLDTPELERFVSQVLALRAKRLAPTLSKQEAELLLKINQHWPVELQRRYDELTLKRQAETLTPDERMELLALITQTEQADADRAQAIGNLAQLRSVSVLQLMQDLGIRPAEHG